MADEPIGAEGDEFETEFDVLKRKSHEELQSICRAQRQKIIELRGAQRSEVALCRQIISAQVDAAFWRGQAGLLTRERDEQVEKTKRVRRGMRREMQRWMDKAREASDE